MHVHVKAKLRLIFIGHWLIRTDFCGCCLLACLFVCYLLGRKGGYDFDSIDLSVCEPGWGGQGEFTSVPE